MASYPTSVKSYTTKADGAGNKIFAAHINDLQDEVTAIEDGLLNGTAPVNSSRITAPSLSVSGASTVATLSVTGGSTFAGVLQLTAQPRFCGYSTTAQTISANSTVVLNLISEDIDVGGLHSTAASPSRVTIPVGSSGAYYCAGQTIYNVSGVASVGDAVRLILRKTGTDQVVHQAVVFSTGVSFSLRVDGLLVLDAGDYVELAASAQTNAWSAGTTIPALTTRLSVVKVG